MIQFFQTIAQAIKGFFDCIVYAFTFIPKLLAGVNSAIVQFGFILSSLPSFIAGLGIVVLFCAVIFLILRIFHG